MTVEFEGTGDQNFDHSYGRPANEGWQEAVVLKAAIHTKKGTEDDEKPKRSIRVGFGLEGPEGGVRIDHFSPTKPSGFRTTLFRALGYAKNDKAGGGVPIEEWPGLACMVKIRNEEEEYEGETRMRPVIKDLKAIDATKQTRKFDPPPPEAAEGEGAAAAAAAGEPEFDFGEEK